MSLELSTDRSLPASTQDGGEGLRHGPALAPTLKLYGRQAEVARLVGTYQNVLAEGGKRVLLISGPAGSGKSCLLDALAKHVNSGLGVFASEKSEHRNNVPYTALTEAIQELVGQQLRWCGEPELEIWRKKLKAALSHNGQLMIDLVPEIAGLLGPQPATVALPIEGTLRRLHSTLGALLATFASRKHPLVLFFDSLETLDIVTLDFFHCLALQDNLDGVLFVGAYRSEEYGRAGSLHEIVASLLDDDRPAELIELENLPQDRVREMLCDQLACEGSAVDELAHLVHGKAGGNPFFSAHLMSVFREEGFLAFSRVTGRWEWDVENIRASHEGIDAVDLVIAKLSGLSGETMRILRLLACFGPGASSGNLAVAAGLDGVDLGIAFEQAANGGVISKVTDGYAFSHERVRSAVYDTIPPESRDELHLGIAQALLSVSSSWNVTVTADQFNKVLSKRLPPETMAMGIDLNLRAGLQAKAVAVPATAQGYFSKGASLLVRESWLHSHEQAFSLLAEQGRGELVRADHAAVDILIAELVSRARSKPERAAVCRLRMELHMRRSETTAAVAVALECLREFGIVIPAHPTQAELDAVFIEVWHKLDSHPVAELVNLPQMEDRDVKAAMGILASMYDGALFTDKRLVGFHLCVMVRLTLDHGVTDASAHAFGFFGFAIAHYFGRYGDGYQFCEVALDLLERRGLAEYEGKVLLSHALVSTWTHPMDFAITASKVSLAASKRRGDIPYACYTCHHIITEMLARGDHLDDVSAELERTIEYVDGVGFKRVVDVLVSQRRFIASMQRDRGSEPIFSDEEFDETLYEASLVPDETPLKVYWHWIIKARAFYVYGELAAAIDTLDRAKPYIWAALGHIQLVDFHFLSGLMLGDRADIDHATVRSEMVEHSDWMGRWAENSPSSFASKHLLLLAELARVDGRTGEAERLYERSIEMARRYGLVSDEAMATEVAGRFYEARGAQQTASAFFRNARDCYHRWGATGKARHLEARYKNRWEQRPVPQERTSRVLEGDDAVSISSLSLSISEELETDRLADRILRLAMGAVGSTKAFLVASRPEGLWIEAQAEKARGNIEVKIRDEQMRGKELSDALVRHVARTLEVVDLGDGGEPNSFDERHAVSAAAGPVFCLPLVKHVRLIAVLYLEGRFENPVVVARGISTLKLLGPQMAISLENARVVAGVRKENARLVESERELRVASDAMPTLTFSSDSVGGSEQFNKQWYEYTGLTPEEARDGGWKYTFHPDDRAASAAAWHRAVTTKETGEVELRLRRHDGEYRWFLVRARPFCDSTGQIIRVYGTESDIDDLKRAEALLAGEKRLFEMIATGHSLAAILDSLCATIGELSGESLISVMLLDDDGVTLRSRGGYNLPAGFARAVDGIVVGPTAGSCGTAAYRKEAVMVDDIATDPLWLDYAGLARDFDLRACWSTPIRATNGSVLGTIAIYSRQSRSMTERERQVVDQFNHLASIVIERRAAEGALKKSEALLADGQRISSTGSWAWNVQTGKIVWSDEHCRIFGYRINEVGGTIDDMLERMLPDEAAALRDVLRGPISRKEDFQFEYQATLPTGVIKQLSCTGRASVNDVGDLVEYVGTTMDITERKRVEGQLTRSAAHLREVQAELAHVARATTMGELAASIAHEVNQPLTGIIASGGAAFRWLSKDVPDVAKAKESLQNVIGDGKRASEVIARIRKMFRKELGSREPLEISEVLEDVVALTRVELQKNEVTLRFDLPDGLPAVPGDRVQLQQVFVNLILNAIDAMKSVDRKARVVTVKVSPEKNYNVRINVTDTGSGVEAADTEKIFRPFFTSKPGGMGMGLSICRSIIENHGGKMRLVKDHSPGSCFEVTLPTNDTWMGEI